VWSGRHGRMALVGAALALGSCQDQAFVRLFPGAEPSTNGGASGLGALGGTGGAGAGAVGGTGAPGGAGSAGTAGGGALGGSAGTEVVAGSAPVGGEAGAGGETAHAGEGGAGAVGGEAGAAGASVDLIHRYDFSGTGTVVRDLVGGADGTFVNGELGGMGYASLDGDDQYIELPSGIISTLHNATFVMWIRWTGIGDWERVFDFGNNDAVPPAEIGNGITTFWLTPCNIPRAGNADEAAFGWQPAPSSLYVTELGTRFLNEETQVSLVVDADQSSVAVYLGGQLSLRATYAADSDRMVDLSGLDDQNNWLGRSQWTQDAISNFEGIYDEFRIYATALDDAYIAELHRLGQDTLPE
jgi:hypothetical protein